VLNYLYFDERLLNRKILVFFKPVPCIQVGHETLIRQLVAVANPHERAKGDQAVNLTPQSTQFESFLSIYKESDL
jgi:hypothetical protein